MIKGLGINSHGGTIDGNLGKFKEEIMYYSECGFDYVEIAPHGLDVILYNKVFSSIDFPRPKVLVFELKPRYSGEARECITRVKEMLNINNAKDGG